MKSFLKNLFFIYVILCPVLSLGVSEIKTMIVYDSENEDGDIEIVDPQKDIKYMNENNSFIV